MKGLALGVRSEKLRAWPAECITPRRRMISATLTRESATRLQVTRKLHDSPDYFQMAKNNRSKSACTFIQRKRFNNQAVWPVIFGITGPICARALNLKIRTKIRARGHHDWPVMPTILAEEPPTLWRYRRISGQKVCLLRSISSSRVSGRPSTRNRHFHEMGTIRQSGLERSGV